VKAQLHKMQSFQGDLNILKMSEINSNLQRETPEKNDKEKKSSEVLRDKTKPDLNTFVSEISRIIMSLLKNSCPTSNFTLKMKGYISATGHFFLGNGSLPGNPLLNREN